MIKVRSDIQKQINNYVRMKCDGLFELPLFSIGTGGKNEKLSCRVSVNVVTFEPGTSQLPSQTTTSVSDRLNQTTISQLSLQMYADYTGVNDYRTGLKLLGRNIYATQRTGPLG